MIDTGPLWIRLGRNLFPNCCWQGDGSRRVIAFSYDDGPDPERTPIVLDVLDQYEVCATFFWLGNSLDRADAVVKRVAASQHAIGLHGTKHSSFYFNRTATLIEHLKRLTARIADLTGRAAIDLRW